MKVLVLDHEVLVLDQQFQYNTMLLMLILSSYFITLLDAVQCIVIGSVCLCVCGWVCYHDNSKLRASILTKLGL